MSSGRGNIDKKARVLQISAAIYVAVGAVALALIPITEGRSLIAFCPIFLCIAVQGVVYVIIS